MQSLQLVQTGMRVFQIICRVVLIITCVSAGLIVVAMVLAACGSQNTFVVFVSSSDALSLQQTQAMLGSALITAVLDIVLLALAGRYFSAERRDGTPFTHSGARQLRRLGILMMILSVVSAGVAVGIQLAMHLPEDDSSGFAGSILLGGVLLVVSFVFSYGADVVGADPAGGTK